MTDTQLLTQLAQTPLVAAVIWLAYMLRRELAERPVPRASKPGPDPDALNRTREDLSAFKVEVARTYVPLSLIRDVDQRLTQHLLRIEEKLDEVSRSAAATAHYYAQAPHRGGEKR